MKTLARAAFSSAAAVALLAGCGASQPPIGTAAGMPQTSAIARAGKDPDRIQLAASYKVLYDFEPSDGEDPESGLIKVKDEFYGTTLAGGSGSCGSGGCGTVYKINENGLQAVLHRFGGRSDGINPYSGLVNVNGTLYGTTVGGGKFSDGTVYRISTTGSEKVLYDFRGGSDGANPAAALINVNGTLEVVPISGGTLRSSVA